MSFDYAATAATATELLTEFGQAVTRRSYTAGTYNVANGVVGSLAPTDTTRRGALFDFGAAQTLVRGGLVQVGDKRLLLDPAGPVEPQDHFVVNSVEYVIMSVSEINPAGTRVLYDLHLRK